MSTQMTYPRSALSDAGYEIPRARLRRRRVPATMTATFLVIALWFAYRAGQDELALHGFDHQALLWTALMLAATHQTILAWLDRPYTATARQRQVIDALTVSVNIPVFNESREIVDRVLWALYHQSRLPDRVDLVDDGSRNHDYTDLREFWIPRFRHRGVEFTWMRQPNRGKRHAQAVTFRTAPGGAHGIVVTLDSDTVLEQDAIAQILIPFASRDVQSVAGVELARNQGANPLTRINGMRQLTWQMVQCCALNMVGSVLVNRGTFAAYRAALVRENVDAYLAETFMGKPVKYSDDSLLTLYALGRGRAVQQMSAFQFAEYPEGLSHALRQWIRWMRGSTIRSIWRARYLPVTSYGWWINLLNWWQLIVSSAAYGYVFVYLPTHGRLSLSAFSAAIASAYLSNVRSLLVARSDQKPLHQLDTFLLSPLSWLWSLLILRPLRIYGMLTCANNGWGTRAKVEVGMDKNRAWIDATQERKPVAWSPPENDPAATHPTEPVRVPLDVTAPLSPLTDATITTTPRVKVHVAGRGARFPRPPVPLIAAATLLIVLGGGALTLLAGARGPALPTAPQVAQLAPPTLTPTPSAAHMVLPPVSTSAAPVTIARPIRTSAKPGHATTRPASLTAPTTPASLPSTAPANTAPASSFAPPPPPTSTPPTTQTPAIPPTSPPTGP